MTSAVLMHSRYSKITINKECVLCSIAGTPFERAVMLIFLSLTQILEVEVLFVFKSSFLIITKLLSIFMSNSVGLLV